MSETRILVVSRNPSVAEAIRGRIAPLGMTAVRCVEDFEFVESGFPPDPCALVVVHVDENIDVDVLRQALALRAVRGAEVPVLALSETYRADQAAELFRLGVSDYLSWADHHDRIASVVAFLTGLGQQPDDGESKPVPRKPAEVAGNPSENEPKRQPERVGGLRGLAQRLFEVDGFLRGPDPANHNEPVPSPPRRPIQR